jgi:hypothetical protein
MLSSTRLFSKRQYSFIVSRYLEQYVKSDGRVFRDTPNDILNTVVNFAISHYKFSSYGSFLDTLPSNKIEILTNYTLVNVVMQDRGSFYQIPSHRKDDILKIIYTEHPHWRIFGNYNKE